MQIKPLLQQREGCLDQFVRFFANLTVKLRVVIGVHAPLKCLRGVRSVKELSRDAQSTDLIAGKPSSTNLVGLGLHAEAANARTADDLARLGKKLDAF
jgi:hypothetical protein